MARVIHEKHPVIEVLFVDAFDEWLTSQDEDVQLEAAVVMNLLACNSSALTRPYADKLSPPSKWKIGAPSELRFRVRKLQYRLLYIFHDGNAYMLAGDYKNGKKDFYDDLFNAGKRAWNNRTKEN